MTYAQKAEVEQRIRAAIAKQRSLGRQIVSHWWFGAEQKCMCPMGAVIIDVFDYDDHRPTASLTRAAQLAAKELGVTVDDIRAFIHAFDDTAYHAFDDTAFIKSPLGTIGQQLRVEYKGGFGAFAGGK